MAFADMRHHYSGDLPFTTKALRHYGSALQCLQNIVDDGHMMSDDRVLAAMLLIDSFESLYLGRTEPLGPHFDAVMHVLHARGENQFFDHTGFSLWRVAHHRLLARQIMKREQPYPEQVAWFSKLDINNTPLRISSDVQRMSSLTGAAKKITSGDSLAETSSAENMEQARQLARAMQDLLESIGDWTTAMTETWKPTLKDPDEIRQWEETDESSFISIPHFKCPRTLSYRNIWLAYMWNFHAASQIVLRESLTEIVDYIATSQPGSYDEDEMQRYELAQQTAVHALSSVIIRTFPQLLGFMHKETREPYPLPKGKMAGRFFSLFAMCVVRTARFTTNEHKQTASEVIEWISSSHGLG
ncbi:hypothetical protein H2200_003978 [Cladophialophora chaetospira]|uniref:Uncharacterized protein n=1 Tax=Cladophialophora chaetospira TaxID=386627 RepID=A0AA39CLJ6_9EURO|nr:hypothetical protein H2200_003978 [Cladophialophora chaetospira]